MGHTALRTSSADPKALAMTEALVFAVAPSEAGRPSHPHLDSSSTLQAVRAGIRSAGEKPLAACSVNTRAVKAHRFPFPQSCKMSVHSIAPNAFPPREGTSEKDSRLHCLQELPWRHPCTAR